MFLSYNENSVTFGLSLESCELVVLEYARDQRDHDIGFNLDDCGFNRNR